MKIETSDRGFQYVQHWAYLPPNDEKRIVSQSSAIGSYSDSLDRPGTSYLWVGDHHHLNREEVAELRDMLTRWLETGNLGERQ